MSYHLTILRSENGKLQRISLDEAIAATSHLRGWVFDGRQNSFEFSGFEGSVTLWFQDGELWTEFYDAWQFAPLLALAEQLGARLRGDEFETYSSAETTFSHPDDVQLQRESKAKSKPLYAKQMRQEKYIRNGIVGVFVLLGVVAFLIGKWFENR